MSRAIPKFGNPYSSTTYQNLQDTVDIVDLKIAHFYLTGGSLLKEVMRKDRYLKCLTIDKERYLMAKPDLQEHKSNVTSLERAVAASAIFVIRRLESMKQMKVGDGSKMLDLSETTNTYLQLEYDGKKIFNPLAESVGLKPSSELYYIYNIGLEFMIEDYPVQTSALLEWRFRNHDIIFSNRSGSSFSSLVDKSKQYHKNAYYKRIAKANNFRSVGELWNSHLPHILKFADYLERIDPADGAGRKNEARKMGNFLTTMISEHL